MVYKFSNYLANTSSIAFSKVDTIQLFRESNAQMKESFNAVLIALILLLSSMSLMAQEKVTLNGYVRDNTNGEVLIAATVFIPEIGAGTYTNEYGFYSLTIEPGEYTLLARYTGYKISEQKLSLQSETTVNIDLESENFQLEEVVIEAQAKNENVSSAEISTVKLSISEIQRMPQLLGEVDVIRSIQLLPGVTTVGEGATGFNVRGGNVDQNLVLLDEAPVYNSSHLLGFFSIFNADAIKDVKLYKGGIPAFYGGRLSSVLDVRQKDGNLKRFSGRGGIGLLSSRLTLETPIVKDKGSFMLAGRRTYLDLFLRLSPDEAINSNTLFFYDLNAKANYKINDNNRIYLSGYLGNDVFGFQDDFRFRWGNESVTFRWNHLFNSRLFSNFTAIYSNYEYLLGIPEGVNAFDWTSNIVNWNLKADFGYFVSPSNTIKMGVSSIFYEFQPGQVDFKDPESGFEDFNLNKEFAVETAAYFDNELKLWDNRLTVKYGLRFSLFQNVGKSTVFLYDEGMPRLEENITDTVQYSSGELVETFTGFEPRFSASWLLDDKQSIKIGYNRMRQYIHLVSNTTAATPIDVWKPAGTYVEPATVDQVNLGYFRNFNDNAYEASVEVYYKDFQNLLDFVNGAELLFNPTIETELVSGKGRAYGVELSVRKKEGKLTGWLAYTLSRTERKIDGINSGEWYLSNYDKLHDLSLVLAYQLSDRWSVSGIFSFMSGRPITYPDGRYFVDGITVPNYNNRNGARTPAYHRMDLSADYKLKEKPDKRWKQSLNFGIYNVYNRRNPYSIFFRQNEDDPLITEAVRLSIFASIIPSITYNFEF